MTQVHDVTDEAAWAATEAAIRDRFGCLDLAVVNAGIAAGGSSIAELDVAWRRVLSVNLDVAFLTSRGDATAAPRRRGGGVGRRHRGRAGCCRLKRNRRPG